MQYHQVIFYHQLLGRQVTRGHRENTIPSKETPSKSVMQPMLHFLVYTEIWHIFTVPTDRVQDGAAGMLGKWILRKTPVIRQQACALCSS